MIASPTFEHVEAAASRLQGAVIRTPVLNNPRAPTPLERRFHYKMENFQRGGAFKFRGAFNAMKVLAEKGKCVGVVTYSSGNHAIAIATAARMLGFEATVVMPSDAPMAKFAEVERNGAHIVRYDRGTESREAIAALLMRERGYTLIPPFDHVDIIAGQGTAAVELFEEVGELDFLYVPVGGGGLISGCALAAEALSPNCKIIGVEPLTGDDARQSLRLGERVRIELPATIADGAQTLMIGEITFGVIKRLVSEILVVDDAALRHQMFRFLDQMKVMVEPTGCLAAAAAIHAPVGARVGIIVSGGNSNIVLEPPKGQIGQVEVRIA